MIGGRTGVVVGLFVFVATYLYGLLHFGWLAGIAFGWLPCGLMAWLSALAAEAVTTSILRSIILSRSRMSSSTENG